MKKYYFLIIVALILGLVLSGCTLLSNIGQVPSTEQKGMPLSTADLVALWHFDGDADDSTVNNNDGTVSGASWVDDGKLGKALSFDGNDYVIVSDSSLLEPDRITVEAWVKSSGTPGNYKYIVSKYLPTRPGSYSSYGLYTASSGGLRFYIGLSSYGVLSPDAGTDVWDGNWHHVAGTYDGSAVKLYVDGEPVAGAGSTTSDIFYEGTGNLFIGAYTTTSYCFSGTIDEVRIWDGALTADEIFYSYNNEILHVDDDWAQWPGAYYTITEALAVAVDDDTIIVHEGTYYENITINKTLTIEGASGSIINGDANVDGSPDGNCITINADGVTIYGFEITNGFNGIVAGACSNLIIINNKIHHNVNNTGVQGCGITLWAQSGPCNSNLIGKNEVYYNEREGIFIGTNSGESNSENNTIRGNTVYDNGTDGYDSFGIQLNYACGNTIKDNEVYNHTYTASSWLASGIYFYNSNDNLLTGNNIHNNFYGFCQWIPDTGIRAYYDNEIHYNNIENNSSSGISNFSSETNPDATCNWWGDDSGPSSVGPGSGDAVSANVLYNPWWVKTSSLVYTGTPQPENSVVLKATLSDSTPTGISGMDIEFYLDGYHVGIATTDPDGVARLELVSYGVGIYDVYATACDLTSDTAFLVVYDPFGGFVTGGGWIDSPAGASIEYPDAVGKASFGFVSKYKKGQSTPTGNTEFQFKAGDLNFHSDDYDWMIISGAKAKYKGTGTINGTGEYGFMLSAIDEKLTSSTDVDMFRIKIWNKGTDNLIYDNQMGDDDNADPTTEIGGGQIVIHKK